MLLTGPGWPGWTRPCVRTPTHPRAGHRPESRPGRAEETMDLTQEEEGKWCRQSGPCSALTLGSPTRVQSRPASLIWVRSTS